MYCVKCGNQLDQGKCPNCGFDRDAAIKTAKSKKFSSKPKKKVRIKQPKEKKPLLKKTKIIIICASAAAFLVLAGVGAFLTIYLLKDAKYNESIALLSENKLKAAASSFEELEDFKNSPDFLEEIYKMMDYNDAKDALENGDFEDAISMFADLNGYLDSRALEDLAQQHFDYEEAKVLYDSGAFEQAKVAYLTLGSFEDSIAMVESCQIRIDYEEAQSLYAGGQFLRAKSVFDTIADFEDSKEMSFICESLLTYEEAMDQIDNEMFTAAEVTLKQLRETVTDSSVDLSEVINMKEIGYYIGVSYYEQELFYSAYKEFREVPEFSDSIYLAGQCIQPFSTKELYINPDYKKNSVKITYHAPKDDDNICLKIYAKDGELVSICLVETNKKLKIYLPSGTYYYEISYGEDWFGREECFGTGFDRITFTDGKDTQKLSSRKYYWIKF